MNRVVMHTVVIIISIFWFYLHSRITIILGSVGFGLSVFYLYEIILKKKINQQSGAASRN